MGREVELKWRASHQKVLKQYAGQWVVLEGERIVAAGFSLGEVVRKASKLGIAIPYVFRVEAKSGTEDDRSSADGN